MKNFKSIYLFVASWTFVFFFSLSALAQPVEQGSLYKSSIDDLLTIKSITVLPFSDNLQGIYARPLEAHVVDILKDIHRFDYLESNSVGPILSPQELEESPSKTQQVASSIVADAFLVTRIIKGPKGINIRMNLFLKDDAQLLFQEELVNYQIFDIENLKAKTAELLQKIVAKIPYEGRILSRDGNRVTVNLGNKDGIQAEQTVSVIQIISATRHPKFNFLVSTEKEILGKVKLLKIDDTLSFGVIVSEREKGAIQKEAKISGIDFVSYSGENPYASVNSASNLETRPDSEVSFGKNPTAWVPKDPPSFGRIGAQLGLGMFTGSSNLSSSGAVEAKNSLSPNILLDGEIWITPQWTMSALLHQGIITVDNPLGGSSPSELNQNFSRYELLAGYTFRVGPDIWGTNVQLQGGWASAQLYVDDSTPRAFTRTTFSGFKLGVQGSFPVTPDQVWRAGAKFYLHLQTNLSEAPVTSGASNSPKVNEFGVFGGKKIGEDLMITGHLDFLQYSSSFSGQGTRSETASSLSHRFTLFTAGISYFF